MPGATPATFQNAQTDTPGRSLRTNVNGMRRTEQQHPHRRREQRQHLAAPSRRLCRAGRDDRDRQHRDQQLRRRRRAWPAARRSRSSPSRARITLKGSAFYFRNQDELNAKAFFDPDKAEFEHHDRRRHGRRPDREEQAVLLRGHMRAITNATAGSTSTRVPTAKMRNGDFSEVLAVNPSFQSVRSRDRQHRWHRPDGVPWRGHSGEPPLQPRPADPGALSGAEQPGHEQRAAEQPVHRRATPRPTATTTTSKVNWNRNSTHQILREVLDHAGQRGSDLF